jgi:hypothetical protein
MLWFFSLICCRGTEPVLVGIPSEALLEERTTPKDARIQVAQKKTKAKHYQKPEGVVVDVQGFGGTSFQEAQPHLAEQLGDFVDKYKLTPRDGVRRIYERGEVRVVDDTIYMIRFDLPEPMRRSDALKAAGFMEYVDEYIISHHEYQVLYKWEFVRFRMKRTDSVSEFVNSFEGWKWIPLEQANR